MIEKKDIKKLALLSRIEISEHEETILQKDMEAILGYISQIKEVVSESSIKEVGDIRNVMREDSDPHEKGVYTEKIMNEVPDKENGYVKVKQIL